MGASHGLHFFTNYSNYGFPTGPARPPAAAWSPLCTWQLPSGHIHLLWHAVLHRLQGANLLCHGTPWATGQQPVSPWSSPQTAGESPFKYHEHLFPLLLQWHWCLQKHESCLVLHYACINVLVVPTFPRFFQKESQMLQMPDITSHKTQQTLFSSTKHRLEKQFWCISSTILISQSQHCEV